MFSLGNSQIMYVNHPDLIKEITTHTTYDLGKPAYHRKEFGALLGDGILTTNGPTWAYHRKVLAPELYMEKIKVCEHIIMLLSNLFLCFQVVFFGETKSPICPNSNSCRE